MKLKHKVKIRVADRRGRTQDVLESRRIKLPSRLLRFLFGDLHEVMILTPGSSVQGVEIEEMRGEGDE